MYSAAEISVESSLTKLSNSSSSAKSVNWTSGWLFRNPHFYQHIWTPVEGETCSCTREARNEQDCNAVAVMYKDRVVDHIPLAISKCISLFLTLPGSFLETEVTGKRINRGGGYGLEVPCKYRISGQEKAVDWIKRKATTFLQEHSLAVNECLREKYK